MARRSEFAISQCRQVARDESLTPAQRLENVKLYRAAVRELQRDRERMRQVYGGPDDELKQIASRLGVLA
jgi:hypothetical protein